MMPSGSSRALLPWATAFCIGSILKMAAAELRTGASGSIGSVSSVPAAPGCGPQSRLWGPAVRCPLGSTSSRRPWGSGTKRLQTVVRISMLRSSVPERADHSAESMSLRQPLPNRQDGVGHCGRPRETAHREWRRAAACYGLHKVSENAAGPGTARPFPDWPHQYRQRQQDCPRQCVAANGYIGQKHGLQVFDKWRAAQQGIDTKHQ